MFKWKSLLSAIQREINVIQPRATGCLFLQADGISEGASQRQHI